MIGDVKKNPEVRPIWEADADLVEHRAIMPDCRFVVRTWVEAEPSDGQRGALGGPRNAWADETHWIALPSLIPA